MGVCVPVGLSSLERLTVQKVMEWEERETVGLSSLERLAVRKVMEWEERERVGLSSLEMLLYCILLPSLP